MNQFEMLICGDAAWRAELFSEPAGDLIIDWRIRLESAAEVGMGGLFHPPRSHIVSGWLLQSHPFFSLIPLAKNSAS